MSHKCSNKCLICVCRLDIGPEKIRIGIVTYSNVVHTLNIFGLQEGSVKDDLIDPGILQQPNGELIAGTATARALAAMINIFETEGGKMFCNIICFKDKIGLTPDRFRDNKFEFTTTVFKPYFLSQWLNSSLSF